MAVSSANQTVAGSVRVTPSSSACGAGAGLKGGSGQRHSARVLMPSVSALVAGDDIDAQALGTGKARQIGQIEFTGGDCVADIR